MSTRLEKCSKSLPPAEFQLYTISGEDSGIDSDSSPVSSTKLSSSVEDIEDEITTDPKSFLLGKTACHADRIDGITKALSWLREELTQMKETDKHLTKTFITVRSKIAEQKKCMESGEYPNFYHDTDSLPMADKNKKKENWSIIAKDGAFPTDGLNFENNKRATWVI